MSLRGAIAEEHLGIDLDTLVKSKQFARVERAATDSDIDFTVTVPSGSSYVVECKNAMAIKLNQPELAAYLQFLISRGYVTPLQFDVALQEEAPPLHAAIGPRRRFPDKEVYAAAVAEVVGTRGYKGYADKAMKRLPAWAQFSSLPRYQFSRWRAAIAVGRSEPYAIGDVDVDTLLEQFGANSPLTVDLQRTRGGTDGEGSGTRPYRVGKLDVLAVCLHARTLRWEFLYGHSLPTSNGTEYDKKVELLPGHGRWFATLPECITDLERLQDNEPT